MLNSRSLTFVFSVFLTLLNQIGAASENCKSKLERLGIDVAQLPVVKGSFLGVPADYKIIPVQNIHATSISKNPNDLFIGINSGHAYFVWRGKRFDGGSLIMGIPLPAAVRESDLVGDGAVIKVTLNEQQTKPIKTGLSSALSRINISCGSGVCRAIDYSCWGMIIWSASAVRPPKLTVKLQR